MRHACVIGIVRAQTARERRHNDYQERGELCEVVQHLSQGHLHRSNVVVELAQKQQSHVSHDGGHGEQGLGYQLRVSPVPVSPIQIVRHVAGKG